MSNRAMTWAFEAPIVSPGAKFVLVALADHASDHAGEDWTCFPSVERLMQFTSQSRATVERHLAALVADGWVTRVRRKQSNGRLGVYDYVLHRVQKASDEGVCDDENGCNHAANCSMDHASICSPAMRQNDGQPCCKLQHVLTPIEPSVEPPLSARAREARPDWAGEVWQLWPEEGRLHSSIRQVEGALRSELEAGADPAKLIAAAAAYAANPKAWGRSGAPLAPHNFYTLGRWEQFAETPAGGPGGSVAAGSRFMGPPELRDEFVATFSEAEAVSYLDPCDWWEGERGLVPRTGFARNWLAERCVGLLGKHDVRLSRVGQTQGAE